MKVNIMKFVLRIGILILLATTSAFASSLNQPVDSKKISGDPLRIEVGSNGSIQVYHKNTGDVGAAYGTADSGFFLAIGNDI